MGSLYRSEQMRFCQMIVQKDAAFACVAELGKHPYVQFKDVLFYGINQTFKPFILAISEEFLIIGNMKATSILLKARTEISQHHRQDLFTQFACTSFLWDVLAKCRC